MNQSYSGWCKKESPRPQTGVAPGPGLVGRWLPAGSHLTGPSLSPTGVLQQSMRENKEKQALSDLMIKPVQRIPRYELLVKVGAGSRVQAAGCRQEAICAVPAVGETMAPPHLPCKGAFRGLTSLPAPFPIP